MKVRLVILFSIILVSYLMYSGIGWITSLIGNNIEGTFSRFAYKVYFMIKSIGVGLVLLTISVIGGLIYSKKNIKDVNYFAGFIYASVYIGVLLLVYLYLMIFKAKS